MYSIKKASQLLGIPTVTIRAWENRYNIVSPVRSAGGHRLYRDADIEKLRKIKVQIEHNGLKVSEAIARLDQDDADVNQDMLAAPPGAPYATMIDRLFAYLAIMKPEQANETIDLAFSLYHYEDVFHYILTPVLNRVGEAWRSGEFMVAQEHFASQLIMQRCSQFLRLLPTRPHLPKVLALCPEGEHHQMGLMLFSLFLRNKGMQVIYLGPDTPMRELSRLISLIQASVVAVSITNPALLKEVEDAFELCRSEMPSVTFAVGGAAFDNRETRLADYVLSNSKADWETWYRNGNFENTSAEHSFI